MHEEGDGVRSGDKLFVGKPRPALIPPLKALIKSYQAKTLLDYGSGKGMQWQLDFNLGSLWETTETRLKSYLELEEIRCYDPAFQPFSKLPEEFFDGVICLDVLEHCPEQDIAWILDQISLISCRAACSFPGGKIRNASGSDLADDVLMGG